MEVKGGVREARKHGMKPLGPEMGRGAGQVQLISRSGTNQVRGSLFWANHNSALDANSWTNNFNGVQKDYRNGNQFGARLSGPIIQRLQAHLNKAGYNTGAEDGCGGQVR